MPLFPSRAAIICDLLAQKHLYIWSCPNPASHVFSYTFFNEFDATPESKNRPFWFYRMQFYYWILLIDVTHLIACQFFMSNFIAYIHCLRILRFMLALKPYSGKIYVTRKIVHRNASCLQRMRCPFNTTLAESRNRFRRCSAGLWRTNFGTYTHNDNALCQAPVSGVHHLSKRARRRALQTCSIHKLTTNCALGYTRECSSASAVRMLTIHRSLNHTLVCPLPISNTVRPSELT